MKSDLELALSVAKGLSPLQGSRSFGIPSDPWLSTYDLLVQDDGLKRVTRKKFVDQHYSESVFAAYKHINNRVKAKSLRRELDGDKLMKTVFSLASPVLRINTGASRSDEDEQLGYMELFAGAMKGIRNPRGHEDEHEDGAREALELLIFAQHLLNKLESSVRVSRDED